MIIKCINCSNSFNQKANERRCGCRRYIKKTDRINGIGSHRDFWDYMGKERRYYQNPIHQWYKEFINTEMMPRNYKSFMINLALEYSLG